MESNCISHRSSKSKMRVPINFTGVSVDHNRIMKKKVAGSSSAGTAADAAEARRRRIPLMKRAERPLVKRRKRTVIHRDTGFVPPPLPPHIINQERLVYLFYKRLQNTDVSSIGRIVLPKHCAETHLPRLLDNQSISFPMFDMNGVDVWSFKFRYWPNNYSRMYVFESTGAFTRKHQLRTGDYMLIYMDTVNRRYVIRALKGSEVEGRGKKEAGDIEENKTDGIDLVLNDGVDLGAIDLLDFENFPEVDTSCLAGATTMDNDSYVRFVLDSFSSWDELDDPCFQPTTETKKISFDDLSNEDLSQL